MAVNYAWSMTEPQTEIASWSSLCRGLLAHCGTRSSSPRRFAFCKINGSEENIINRETKICSLEIVILAPEVQVKSSQKMKEA